MSSPDPVRAARAMNGAAAAVLVLEGITVLFVPRAIAQSGPGLTGVRLTLLLVLAVALILAGGVQRRPWGVIAGTVLQVPLVLTGLMSPVMWFLGGLFLLIWLYLLQVRRELLGTPFGRPPSGPPPSGPPPSGPPSAPAAPASPPSGDRPTAD